MEEGSKWVELS